MRNVKIFTDGSCLGNPGRGGWGCILRCEGHEKELSGGYAHTTNNRMEIMAAIAGLEELKEPCAVTLYTDSQYLRHAVEKKWLAGWRKNGWKTAAKKPAAKKTAAKPAAKKPAAKKTAAKTTAKKPTAKKPAAKKTAAKKTEAAE